MNKVYRYAEYRRAIWFSTEDNIEELLRDAFDVTPNSDQRIVYRSDGSSIMANAIFDYGDFGVGLQCARYVDGQPVGVVPMTGSDTANLAEKQPGNSENYLDTAIFAVISNNHVVSVNAGRGGAALRDFLRGYFESVGHDENSTKFDLTRIAAVDQIKKIQTSGGVEKVQMDLALSEAAMMTIEETMNSGLTASKMLSSLAGVAQNIFGSDGHPSKLANSNKGKMRLSISVPSRDIQPAKEGLDAVAAVLAQDENADDYVLKLRNGDTITPSEISARRRIRVGRYANTLDLKDVMEALCGYMQELYESGQTST